MLPTQNKSMKHLLMLTGFVTVLTIVVLGSARGSSQGSAQSNPKAPVYFPPDQISTPIAQMVLASLGEPSLFEASKDMSVVAFRLSYFAPVPGLRGAVRLVVNADASGLVIVSAISSGAGAEIKRNQNSVSATEVNKLLQLVSRAEFWSMSGIETPDQKTDAAGRKPYLMDGAFLTVEGVHQGLFHYVSRRYPEPGPITEIACYLGKDLAKPAIPSFESGCARPAQ